MFATKLAAMITAFVFALTILLVHAPPIAEATADRYTADGVVKHWHTESGQYCYSTLHMIKSTIKKDTSTPHYKTYGDSSGGSHPSHDVSYSVTILAVYSYYSLKECPEYT